MKAFWDTLKSEWLGWWRGLSLAAKLGPLAVFLTYIGLLLSVHGLRDDLVVSTAVPLALYYLGPRLHPIGQFIFPLCLTAVIYDSQRYYSDLIRGPIHVKEPYLFDKWLLGIQTAAGVLTPNEWFQLHTHPFLDFVTGLSYIIFIPFYLLTAAYFRFWASRKGTARCSAASLRYRSTQMMWAFFWVNMLGYSTYYWYAAAPPWYVAIYGLGPAQIGVPANLAGCARFDALVGIPIFSNWYGRSADVFGAIPSLHIAYPLLGAIYAFRFGGIRILTTGFYLLICFAAVYLNHHYVLDVLWGSVYAFAVALACDRYWGLDPRAGTRLPLPSPA